MNNCLIMAICGGILIICIYFVGVKQIHDTFMRIIGIIPIFMYAFVMFYIFAPQLSQSEQCCGNYYQPIVNNSECKKQNKDKQITNYNIEHVDTLIINK